MFQSDGNQLVFDCKNSPSCILITHKYIDCQCIESDHFWIHWTHVKTCLNQILSRQVVTLILQNTQSRKLLDSSKNNSEFMTTLNSFVQTSYNHLVQKAVKQLEGQYQKVTCEQNVPIKSFWTVQISFGGYYGQTCPKSRRNGKRGGFRTGLTIIRKKIVKITFQPKIRPKRNRGGSIGIRMGVWLKNANISQILAEPRLKHH